MPPSVTPMKMTTGRMSSANVTKPSPKAVAWATSASATTAPDSAARNAAVRLDVSFQLKARVDNKLQCSVVRICRRRADDDAFEQPTEHGPPPPLQEMGVGAVVASVTARPAERGGP